MDLVHVLRVLWDRRGWLVVAALVAVLAGLLVGFKVSLSPPSLEARSSRYGTATTKVLVDTTQSALTDSARDYEPLVTRAGVYAQLVSTAAVRRLVSRYSGIPSEQIVTDVPSNGQVITNQPRPNQADSSVERSAEIADERQDYRLDIGVEADLPIISIAAQAPDEAQALRLANGAAEGMREYIEDLKPREDAGRAVYIRRLGNAVSGTVGGRTGATAAAGVAIAVFALCCLLIIVSARVARDWRNAESRSPGDDPDVAAERAEAPDEDAHEEGPPGEPDAEDVDQPEAEDPRAADQDGTVAQAQQEPLPR